MRMKGKIFIAIFLVFVLSSVVFFGVFAQVAGGLGVKAGDNFTYNFTAFWSSTNPSKVVPSFFSDMNKTRSIHLNVTDAGDTFAYLDISSRMIDGTEDYTPGIINVETGRGTQDAFLFIIGANLTAGDKAYPFADPAAVKAGAAAESFTITETANRIYLGTSREVNRYHASNADENGTVTRDAYYDRATGILLEMTFSHNFAVTSDETDSERWIITQLDSAAAPDGTNDGTNGTDSTGALPDWILFLAIVAVVVVVAVFVALVMLRRRKTPAVQAPPTVPVQTQTPV